MISQNIFFIFVQFSLYFLYHTDKIVYFLLPEAADLRTAGPVTDSYVTVNAKLPSLIEVSSLGWFWLEISG